MHRNFKLADGVAAGEVAYRIPGKKENGSRHRVQLPQLRKGIALVGREPVFQQVNVVGHALS